MHVHRLDGIDLLYGLRSSAGNSPAPSIATKKFEGYKKGSAGEPFNILSRGTVCDMSTKNENQLRRLMRDFPSKYSRCDIIPRQTYRSPEPFLRRLRS
jgi:hypothetical protein